MQSMIKNFCFAVLCSIILVNLSACTEERETSEQGSIIGESSYAQGNLTDSHPSADPSIVYNDFINTTLSSGVKVRSNIVCSDFVNINSLAVYSGNLLINDYDKAKELLLGSKQTVDEIIAETNESLTNSPYRYCETDDGFNLVSMGESLYFTGELDRTISLIFHNSVGGNSEQFLTGNDLQFKSIELAQRDTDAMLSKLGITVEETPICYTIDYNTLTAECEKRNKMMRETFSKDFTAAEVKKSDECYIFIYQLTPLGLPISTHTNGIFGDGSWTSGTYVQCTYSADGLVALQMNYQFGNVNKIAQNSNGLTVEQALERLDQKYNSIILEGDYLVDKIEFEYVPMPDYGKSNSYTLIPAWRFSILHTYEVPDKLNPNKHTTVTQRTVSVINAITGTELLIDAGSA